MNEVADIHIIITWFWIILSFAMVSVFIMVFANDKYGKIMIKVFGLFTLLSWLFMVWLIL